ncbi:hypothetical protein V0242_25590 (plasmid) [Aeromonas hydrophila]|uniref:hypothetical protein n=1 Tax=Aeromonas hydrophila TaxID=644 RepID=UPI002ED3CBD2|nr:hypothetical protein V0242_25590 [Aeromonas hydrophila]
MSSGPTIQDIAKAHANVIPRWVITFFVCMTAAIAHLACGLDDVWQHGDLVGLLSLLSKPWIITVAGFLISLSRNAEINKRARDIYRDRMSQEYAARY